MDAVYERVRAVVAGTFQLAPEDVTRESSPKTVEAWDSMGHLTLVLELEQEFGVQLAPEDVERMTSVGTIAAIVHARAEAA